MKSKRRSFLPAVLVDRCELVEGPELHIYALLLPRPARRVQGQFPRAHHPSRSGTSSSSLTVAVLALLYPLLGHLSDRSMELVFGFAIMDYWAPLERLSSTLIIRRVDVGRRGCCRLCATSVTTTVAASVAVDAASAAPAAAAAAAAAESPS